MAQQIRRIVTGHNAAGKSILAQDAIATSILELPAVPGLRATDLWETTTAPADLSSAADPVARPMHLEPAPTGTIFRIVEFPPDAQWQNRPDARDWAKALDATHAPDRSSSDPMMHKTSTVDYIVVLKGEIHAILDKGETLLKPGDLRNLPVPAALIWGLGDHFLIEDLRARRQRAQRLRAFSTRLLAKRSLLHGVSFRATRPADFRHQRGYAASLPEGFLRRLTPNIHE